jgi:hypothetical protein
MLSYEDFCESIKTMNSDDSIKKTLYDIYWQIYKMKNRMEEIEDSLKELHDSSSEATADT